MGSMTTFGGNLAELVLGAIGKVTGVGVGHFDRGQIEQSARGKGKVAASGRRLLGSVVLKMWSFRRMGGSYASQEPF